MKALMRILLSAFLVTSLVFAGCMAVEEGEEMMEEEMVEEEAVEEEAAEEEEEVEEEA